MSDDIPAYMLAWHGGNWYLYTLGRLAYTFVSVWPQCFTAGVVSSISHVPYFGDSPQLIKAVFFLCALVRAWLEYFGWFVQRLFEGTFMESLFAVSTQETVYRVATGVYGIGILLFLIGLLKHLPAVRAAMAVCWIAGLIAFAAPVLTAMGLEAPAAPLYTLEANLFNGWWYTTFHVLIWMGSATGFFSLPITEQVKLMSWITGEEIPVPTEAELKEYAKATGRDFEEVKKIAARAGGPRVNAAQGKKKK